MKTWINKAPSKPGIYPICEKDGVPRNIRVMWDGQPNNPYLVAEVYPYPCPYIPLKEIGNKLLWYYDTTECPSFEAVMK